MHIQPGFAAQPSIQEGFESDDPRGAPRARPQTFMYLRTPGAVEHADEVFNALADEWDAAGWDERIELLLPDGTWENGIVLGLHLDMHPAEIAKTIRGGLAKFDAWAILNARGEWEESAKGGPLSVYFGHRSTAAAPPAQLFLGFDPQPMPEQDIDALRNVYGRDKCIPVFHFRDGRILLIETIEPARTIRSRLVNIGRRIDWLCGCDASGEPFSKEDRELWSADSVLNLSFEDDNKG